MKKTLLILSILIFPSLMIGQVGEAKQEAKKTIIGQSTKRNADATLFRYDETNKSGKNYYMIVYQNAKYSSITDVKTVGFYADDEDLSNLYSMLYDVWETGETINFDLGDHRIYVYKTMGTLYISSESDKDTEGTFLLNKRRLQRLFGKRN